MTQPADPPVSRSGPADEAAAARSSRRARASTSSLRSPRLRLGAIVALALAAGFVVWLLVREDDPEPVSTQAEAAAAAVSPDELESLAASVGHPVFWLGPKRGNTYELTQTANGKIYVRYLPQGVDVGADKPYLTVATYPFPGAYPAIQKQAAREGRRDRAGSRTAASPCSTSGYPQSVHVAYPGVNYQVEVYDPTPARAMQLVSSGQLAHLGSLAASRRRDQRGADGRVGRRPEGARAASSATRSTGPARGRATRTS